jgi:hypothetical protein
MNKTLIIKLLDENKSVGKMSTQLIHVNWITFVIWVEG